MPTIQSIEADLAKPIQFCEKAFRVIESVVASHTEIKKTLADLISKSEALGADITLDVADRGTNILLDEKTGTDLLNYIAWIRSTLVPVVLKTYTEIKGDLAFYDAPTPKLTA